jgi:tripartite-type tricarboxylate transporter receptor subunit TctC
MRLLNTGRRVLSIATLATLAAGLTPVVTLAQESYPNRPLRFVIPFPPGGTTDILSRPIADKMTEFLGQPVLMDFRAGASSIVGAEIASRATPDGYTIFFGGMSSLTMNPATFKKLPYDVARDFAPIGLVGGYNLVLIARMGLPAKNVAELVALAKTKPGHLTYATTGIGGPPHFGSVLLESMAGIKMQHIPFKGNAQINTSMLAEEIDIQLGGYSSVVGLLKANKIKVLATAGPKRLPFLPDLPTVAETYPGFQAGTWFSLVTKRGTPRPIIMRLNKELNRTLSLPEVRKQLEAGGYEPADGKGTPEDLAKLIADDTRRWSKIAKEAKIETD